jgi:hypothetical protein
MKACVGSHIRVGFWILHLVKGLHDCKLPWYVDYIPGTLVKQNKSAVVTRLGGERGVKAQNMQNAVQLCVILSDQLA